MDENELSEPGLVRKVGKTGRFEEQVFDFRIVRVIRRSNIAVGLKARLSWGGVLISVNC